MQSTTSLPLLHSWLQWSGGTGCWRLWERREAGVAQDLAPSGPRGRKAHRELRMALLSAVWQKEARFDGGEQQISRTACCRVGKPNTGVQN